MKIAILTLPLHTNYGGILQAYALQTVLQRMGHDVELLQKNGRNKNNPLSTLLSLLVIIKRTIYKLFRDHDIIILADRKREKESQNINKFIEKNISIRYICSLSYIKPNDYECCVVGSDQIWRRIYYNSQYKNVMFSINPEDGFLGFTQGWDIKRIAYAASFGVDSWEYSPNETLRCAALISKFDSVSVREKSGMRNCSKFLQCKATHVLDPTMLLDKSDYLALINKNNSRNNISDSNRIFCYILDNNDNKSKIVNDFISRTGLEPLYMTGDITGQEIKAPVEEWISAFNNSPFIITDSFHACVFSIIFNKPFVAIGNKGRGLSRFNSLLELFGLRNRLIDENAQTYPSLDIPKWDEVNANLLLLRKKSIDFLINSLK